MIINSLTKALLLNSHCQFLAQMNLIDIWDCLLDHQTQEAAATFESSELMNIDWIWCESSVSECHEKFWVWMRFYSQFWHEISELNWALLSDFDFIWSYFNLILLVLQSFHDFMIQISQEIIESHQNSTVKFELIFLCWRELFWEILILFDLILI